MITEYHGTCKTCGECDWYGKDVDTGVSYQSPCGDATGTGLLVMEQKRIVGACMRNAPRATDYSNCARPYVTADTRACGDSRKTVPPPSEEELARIRREAAFPVGGFGG